MFGSCHGFVPALQGYHPDVVRLAAWMGCHVAASGMIAAIRTCGTVVDVCVAEAAPYAPALTGAAVPVAGAGWTVCHSDTITSRTSRAGPDWGDYGGVGDRGKHELQVNYIRVMVRVSLLTTGNSKAAPRQDSAWQMRPCSLGAALCVFAWLTSEGIPSTS